MRTPTNLRRAALVTAVAAVAAACGSGDDQARTPAPDLPERSGPLPVLLDYSPTVSDVGALLYLAAHPDVDLRAVTLAGTGESRCDVAVPNTLALLALAGETDVPVACGSTEPLGPARAWPDEWRDAADRLAPLELDAGDATATDTAAADLIAAAAADADGLVIVATGPLTNLAEAITAHPGLADDVAMVYAMGGALSVAGNAPGGAEWNVAADPTAADTLLRSDLPVTLVPLDATDHVPVNRGLYRRMNDADPNPAERAVLDLWTEASPWQTGTYLWDELTAMLAVDPTLAPIGTARVEVVTEGGELGRTRPDADGPEIRVAGRPDRRRAETEFLAGLAGTATE